MTHIALRTAARHGLALLLALGGTPWLAAAQAAPADQSAPWTLNGNGAPGDVTVQQAPDGRLSGAIYGDPLTGYYAPGERIGVWLRGPAGRPIQTTRDLPGFWAGSWRDVSKEMRGRYPRHPWPDDPAAASATLRTKKADARRG